VPRTIKLWLLLLNLASRAIVIGDNETIGYIGEFNAGVIKGLKLPDFASGFELSLSHLIGKSSSTPIYTKMSKSIRRSRYLLQS